MPPGTRKGCPAADHHPSRTVTTNQLLRYCGLIFLVSWTLQVLAFVTTGDINSEAAEAWLVATMFVPLLVTAGYLLRDKTLRKKVHWKPTLRSLPVFFVALLVPTLIAFVVLVVIQRMGYGTSGWFAFHPGGVTIAGGPYLLGLGNQSWPMFVANIAVTALAFSLLNALPAAGEEVAWRGFLQGQLTARLGTAKGIALLGFIWSMWHLPAQLAGYNFPESPIVGSFILSPIELVATSFFLGWLTLKSKSFLPAALAHGAGNSIQEGITSNIGMHVARHYETLITLGVTVVVGVVFAYLLAGFRESKTRRGEDTRLDSPVPV